MIGSKRWTKHSWCRGRGPYSLRGELKFSIKKNKRYFNRQVRRYTKDFPNGKAYRKLAGEKVWNYVV